MEMTLHRALIELKTLKKRIVKETADAKLIETMVGRKDTINGVPVKEVQAKIQGSYDSITSLISNYEKIKYAVIRANAGATDPDTVNVCGKDYTIAELIEALNVVYADNNSGFKKNLLSKMKSELINAQFTVARAQTGEAEEIERYLKSIAGGENNKLSTREVEDQTKLWHQLHDVSLVDPLGLEKKIQALDEEIEKFRVEADATLSEQNAIRKINVDLTTL